MATIDYVEVNFEMYKEVLKSHDLREILAIVKEVDIKYIQLDNKGD